MSEAVIEFINVHKSFKGKEVLQGVDLAIPDARTTVIIGPSGCGKSTTLRLLLRLIEPDEGDVRVDGRSVLAFNRSQLDAYRLQVGMVFQRAALFDSLTVGENVAFSLLENSNMAHDRILAIAREKLSLVNLAGTEDLYPAELSGGMQKRASFARAIARDPKIILYDEPTTGLDPTNTRRIDRLIREMQAKLKVTSIAVTHDIASAFFISDRVALLYNRGIHFVGTPEEAKRSRDPVVAGFIEGEMEVAEAS